MQDEKNRRVRKTGACAVGKYLPATILRGISQYLDETSRLRSIWQRLMEGALAGHVRPVRYTAGRLELHADTSAWASRVRMQQQTILRSLRAEPYFNDLSELRVRVVPAREVLPPMSSHGADVDVKAGRTCGRVPAQAAALIADVSAGIRDPQLRDALQRLSQQVASAAFPQPPTRSRTRKRRN